jgi:hypothetical protein
MAMGTRKKRERQEDPGLDAPRQVGHHLEGPPVDEIEVTLVEIADASTAAGSL